MSGFNLNKIGATLGFIDTEKRQQRLVERVSQGEQLRKLTSLKVYTDTLGRKLSEMKERDTKEYRRSNGSERIAGMLDVYEEIENWIKSTITNGQASLAQLQEESNRGRAKRAS